MASGVHIERALAAVAATLNDRGLDQYDAVSVQAIVTEALGGEESLTVDAGGGLHEQSGVRVGVIRRTDSGEWITERQNGAAERSHTAVPSPPPQGKIRRLLRKLNLNSS
jgi:hypothetical protein